MNNQEKKVTDLLKDHFKNISIDCKCGKKVIPLIYKQAFDHPFFTFGVRLACEDSCYCSAIEIPEDLAKDEKALKKMFNVMIEGMLIYKRCDH